MSTPLPPDLAMRMQRLAEERTLDSRPFPSLDRAIRRKRANRFAAVVVAMAAVAAITTGVVVSDSLKQPRALVPASTATYARDLAEAGYPAKTSGSLGRDQEWLKALQQRIFERGEVAQESDISVVAAGDVQNSMRFAVTLYPGQDGQWVRNLWTGPAGAKPGAMQSDNPGVDESNHAAIPAEAESLFTTAGDRAGARDSATGYTLKPMVLVVSPRGRSASILTSRTLKADGTFTSKRRELPAVAHGVWAGPVSDGELLLDGVQTDGVRVFSADGGGRNLRNPDGPEANEFGYLSVASADITPDQLDIVRGALTTNPSEPSPSIDEVPVYAAGASGPHGTQMAVGLLRAPSGAYLYGLVEQTPISGVRDLNDGAGASVRASMQKTGTLPAGPEPGQVMVGLRVVHRRRTDYVVLAPEGAVKVRVGTATATVRDRVAIVAHPGTDDPGNPPLRAQALDRTGRVIAEITPLVSQFRAE